MVETEVLIVGGGPVGLTMAIDLGQRGVTCLLVDKRPAPGMLPKMERCNARTMEIYRRLGLVDEIRQHGYRADLPMDVFITTSMATPPLVHHTYPSVSELTSMAATVNDGSTPREPYQLISQYTLEPILKAAAEQTPGVTVRFGHEFVDMEVGENGVGAHLIDGDHKTELIRSQYLVGCDGASSTVRRLMGSELEGEQDHGTLRQALILCEDLYDRIPIGRGRHFHILDDRSTAIVVQDDCRHFTLHTRPDDDLDIAEVFRRAVGIPVEFEVLYQGDWTMRLMLASSYRSGPVFIAGDAAHLVIPTGGLGMNTGAGDAIDLSWKLAASLRGWGGPLLLDSYEAERRPIGARNISASRAAFLGRKHWRGVNESLTARGDDVALAELERIASEEQRKSNDLLGIELGYRYDGSPIVAYENGERPDAATYDYRPSTWPGTRVPHVWADDSVSLHDLCGAGFSIIRTSPGIDAEPLLEAMSGFGAPTQLIDVAGSGVGETLGYRLLLVRPDLHVAWRGNSPPAQPAELARLALGWADPQMPTAHPSDAQCHLVDGVHSGGNG